MSFCVGDECALLFKIVFGYCLLIQRSLTNAEAEFDAAWELNPIILTLRFEPSQLNVPQPPRPRRILQEKINATGFGYRFSKLIDESMSHQWRTGSNRNGFVDWDSLHATLSKLGKAQTTSLSSL